MHGLTPRLRFVGARVSPFAPQLPRELRALGMTRLADGLGRSDGGPALRMVDTGFVEAPRASVAFGVVNLSLRSIADRLRCQVQTGGARSYSFRARISLVTRLSLTASPSSGRSGLRLARRSAARSSGEAMS